MWSLLRDKSSSIGWPARIFHHPAVWTLDLDLRSNFPDNIYAMRTYEEVLCGMTLVSQSGPAGDSARR